MRGSAQEPKYVTKMVENKIKNINVKSTCAPNFLKIVLNVHRQIFEDKNNNFHNHYKGYKHTNNS